MEKRVSKKVIYEGIYLRDVTLSPINESLEMPVTTMQLVSSVEKMTQWLNGMRRVLIFAKRAQ